LILFCPQLNIDFIIIFLLFNSCWNELHALYTYVNIYCFFKNYEFIWSVQVCKVFLQQWRTYQTWLVKQPVL
jgi:hypothetical protein